MRYLRLLLTQLRISAALSIAGAVAFALASRLLWTRAIGRYTSASS
ncbi:MAG: hypothetical protein HUU21_35235 [Polyangiaceae bacterium]|nr:hypothetical protein [Polyangiaceae bacterium]